MNSQNLKFESLLQQIKDCSLCQGHLPFSPKPTFFIKPATKILIVGQAPGIRAHNSGLSWNDPSGDRLREWMGLDRYDFYNNPFVSCMSMGFCFPGQNHRNADLPPRPECASTWHYRVLDLLPTVEMILLIGSYAQHFYLKIPSNQPLRQTVQHWRNYLPKYWVLPHPSWRNNHWLQKNPFIMEKLIPEMRQYIHQILAK